MKNLFGFVAVKEDYSSAISDVVPGQSMDLVEMWNRFNRGQRLLVNQRPINLYQCDEDGNFLDPNVKDETFDNVLPDIEDRVDLEEYIEENREKLNKIAKLKKEKQEKEKQEKEKQEKEKQVKEKQEKEKIV